MTTFIALEASGERCSVTLYKDSKSRSIESKELRSHSQLLLPYIDQLFESCQTTLSDLDFIACSQGPGSFTGLRICFSVAQGLAFGAGLPMITVCSLKSMVLAYHNKNLSKQIEGASSSRNDFLTVAVMDARMDQVYWAAFVHRRGHRGTEIEVLIEPQLQFLGDANTQIHQLLQKNTKLECSIVGSGVCILESQGLKKGEAVIDVSIEPTSCASAELALMSWGNGIFVDADKAKLVYLRDTVSWKKRIKIRS